MNNSIKVTNSTIFIIMLFPFFLLSSMNVTSTAFKTIGTASIFIVLSASVFFLFRHILKTRGVNVYLLKMLIPVFLLSFLMLIGYFIMPTTSSILNLAKFVGSLSVLLFFSQVDWTPLRIKIAFRLSLILLIALPLFGDMTFSGPHFVFVLFFILISNSSNLTKIILSGITIYLIYQTGARSLFLLLLVALFTYFLWPFISKSLLRFKTYFALIITLILSLIFIYPKAIFWESFSKLNSLVIQYTGQRLDSGRETLWDTILSYIMQKPYLGYGTGAYPSSVTGNNLSAHNLYIQIAFQNGLIGLALFLIILYTIWKVYYRSKENNISRVSASFFIGILIYSSFEVILIQNKMDTSTMFWLIIAIGVSCSVNKNKTPSV